MIVAGLWYHVSYLCVCQCVASPAICQYLCFQMINLSKCQWVFTKLGVCIDIVEMWFGIVNGQISFLTEYLQTTDPYFHFQMITLVNINGFSPNFVCALIPWRSALGLLIGKFHQFLTVICPRHVRILISG